MTQDPSSADGADFELSPQDKEIWDGYVAKGDLASAKLFYDQRRIFAEMARRVDKKVDASEYKGFEPYALKLPLDVPKAAKPSPPRLPSGQANPPKKIARIDRIDADGLAEASQSCGCAGCSFFLAVPLLILLVVMLLAMGGVIFGGK